MNPDEVAIRELIAQSHRATAAGDVDTVLGLMAEDAVFLVAGQPPMQGRTNFERGLRSVLKEHRIVSSGELREAAVSGDLAHGWSHLSVRIVPRAGGAAATRSGSALSIVRKQGDGRWLLVRDANLLPQAPR